MMNETVGGGTRRLRTGRGRSRETSQTRSGKPAYTYTTIASMPQKIVAAIPAGLLEVEPEIVLPTDVEDRRVPRRDGRDQRVDLGARVEAHEALEERVAHLPLRGEHVPALRKRHEHAPARGAHQRAQRRERVRLVVEEADRDGVVEALLGDRIGEQVAVHELARGADALRRRLATPELQHRLAEVE